MYRTRLTSLSPPTGSRGEVLTFVGDLPVTEGESVWTDGKVIYGNQPRYDVPVITGGQAGGVPAISSSQVGPRGYYNNNGEWKDYDINISRGFVNDSHKIYTLPTEILDAVAYDGQVFVAIKNASNIQIIRDPEGKAAVYQTIHPVDENGDLTDFRFADDLSWTAWGNYVSYPQEIIAESIYYEMQPGTYDNYDRVDHGTEYSVAYFRFSGPKIINRIAQIIRYYSYDRQYIITSKGDYHVYSNYERIADQGQSAHGDVITESVTSGNYGDIGGNSIYWEGTCECISYNYAFGDFWWYGNEPLTNMNIVNYINQSVADDIRVIRKNERNTYFPFSYSLQNNFYVVQHENNSTIFDDNNNAVMTRNYNVERPIRGAYKFNRGKSLILADNHMTYMCEKGESTWVDAVYNYKLNMMKNIKRAK